ncbi:MAG: hypothetical protein OXU23_07330 [Candidatus Poribacteria bacterium]|nr:hypothetical protein [Candidatus Poribacteria bacterium]
MNGTRIELVQWQDPVANPADCQTIYDMLADNTRETLGVALEWV